MKDCMEGDSNPDAGLKDAQKYGQRLAIHVLDELAASEPEHLVGKMVKSSSRCAPLEFLDLRASQLRDAVNHASHLIDEVTGKGNGSTIAFIGLQDFRYWAMELAAIKTGHPILLANPRNALPNTISLLQRTNTATLFYSGAGTPLEAAAKAIQQSFPSIRVYLIPSLEEMIAHTAPHYPYTKTYEEGKDDVILIPHTSGSTANPKPIYYTNFFLNQVDADRLVPQVEGRTLANLTLGQPGDLALAAFPFFHLSGIGTMGLMLFYRLTIVIGPNIEVLSGKIACEIAKTLNLRIMLMLPFMCDALVEYEDEIKTALVGLKYMIWLGGPLARKTGEWITKHLPHVNLWQFYGSTETYMIPMLVPPKSHWHAFEFHPALPATFEQASEDSNLLELVIQRQDTVPDEMLPPVFSLFPNHQEWRTRDLFRRLTDSGCENLLNYEGRVDDILVLNTGSKVNPLHVEMGISTHPALNGCLVFGERYDFIGILLEPKDHSTKAEQLATMVWPSIEKANEGLPAHAQIIREMMLVSSQDVPFVRSAKGNVVRKATIGKYESEIAELYARFFDSMIVEAPKGAGTLLKQCT